MQDPVPRNWTLSTDHHGSRPPAPGQKARTSWWEDPHLYLEWLTPGQRYTLVLVAILTALILKFGLPGETSGLRSAAAFGGFAPPAGSVAGTAPNQAPQDSASPLGLGTSSLFSSSPSGAAAGTVGTPTDDTASGPAVSGATVGGTSGSSTSPSSPASPSPTCPVSPSTTSTPVDSLAPELSALCSELLGEAGVTVPAGSLPGGTSSGSGADALAVRKEWAFLDSPIGASGASDSSWPSSLSVEMKGKEPTVTVGLVQSSSVSSSLVATLGTLAKDGALVQALLVPEPNAEGGPNGFASWVGQILATLKPVELVEIGTGSAPAGSNASTVEAYTAAGLSEARASSSKVATGILWLDGGTSSDDAPVWTALDSADVWSRSSFLATSIYASAMCGSQSAFASLAHDDAATAALPIVSEAVASPGASAEDANQFGCLKSQVAQDPGASVASWRLWEGPTS